MANSYHNTSSLLHLLPPFDPQALLECRVEDIVHALTRLGAAFHVFCADLFRDSLPLFRGHGGLSLRTEHAARLFIFSKVDFGPYEEKWRPFAEMRDLGIPLFAEKPPEGSHQKLVLHSE
jgi:hypothetical protein